MYLNVVSGRFTDIHFCYGRFGLQVYYRCNLGAIKCNYYKIDLAQHVHFVDNYHSTLRVPSCSKWCCWVRLYVLYGFQLSATITIITTLMNEISCSFYSASSIKFWIGINSWHVKLHPLLCVQCMCGTVEQCVSWDMFVASLSITIYRNHFPNCTKYVKCVCECV